MSTPTQNTGGIDWSRPWNTEYVPIWDMPEVKVRKTNAALPLNTLPVEIIRRIFILCLPKWNESQHRSSYPSLFYEEEPGYGVSRAERQKVPLIISSVCTRWREIAVAFPDLWSQPILKVQPEMQDGQRQDRLDLLQVWLKRSRNIKLSFDLVALSGTRGANKWFVQSLTRTLASDMHRIARLRFQTNETTLYAFFFNKPGLNSLQELDYLRPVHEDFTGLNLSNVSTLKALTVEKESYMDPRHRCPTWRTLTELYVKDTVLRRWRHILIDCPNLRRTSAIFHALNPAGDSIAQAAPPTKPIDMRHLEDLCINVKEGNASLKMFDSIHFPTLRRLCIGTMAIGEKAFSWANADHFIAQIKSLSTLIYRGDVKILLQLLPYMPQLTYLSFSALEDVRPFLEVLSSRSQEFGMMLPHLKRLRIDFEKTNVDPGEDGVPIWAIIKFTQTRSAAGFPLESLELDIACISIQKHINYLFSDMNTYPNMPKYSCKFLTSHIPTA